MTDSSILYEDEFVCIVKPNTPGSIPLYTQVGYETTSGANNICRDGLKSYNKRRENGNNLPERHNLRHEMDSTHNDTIFFRAPFDNTITEIDDEFSSKSLDDKIKLLYGNKSRREILEEKDRYNNDLYMVTIDVDPAKTFVYNSDARCIINSENIPRCRKSFEDSKQVLSEYLKKSSWDNEILVKLPHIPPSWFSSCLSLNIIKPPGEELDSKEYYNALYKLQTLKQTLGKLRKITKEEREQLYKEKSAELTKIIKKFELWKNKVVKKWKDTIAPEYSGKTYGGYKATAKNCEMLRRYKRGESIGFTGRSSLKAKGLIPRSSGQYILGPKYSGTGKPKILSKTRRNRRRSL